MKPLLIEHLPNHHVLYQINFEQEILPGQWLSADNLNFPVLNYSDNVAQFIACDHQELPSTFERVGSPLILPDEPQQLMLLADNNAVALILHLVNYLRLKWGDRITKSRVFQILMGTDSQFPFLPVPSQLLIPNMPIGTIASLQLLEDLALPARLASTDISPGCYQGSLVEMLNVLDFDGFTKHEHLVVAIGSKDLLETTKKLFARQPNKPFLINYS